MKKLMMIAICGLSAALLASCGSETSVNVNADVDANRAAMNTTGGAISNAANTAANTMSNTAAALTTESPEDFMATAAHSGMAEVELGKLAAERGQDPEVKKFGQMMVSDHGKANAELKALAAKKNIQLPTDLGPHRGTMEDLRELTGAEFDREYVSAMVEAHENDVELFESQAENSADPDVKAFAAKTLPVLQKHLEQIRSIQAKLK